jgi:DNA-binding NtrC family response regulator
VHVPALRERCADIPMLVHWFLERYAAGTGLQVSSAAMKSLMQYDWPGNVRELENCIERAVALGNGRLIDLGDLPPAIAAGVLAGSSLGGDMTSGSAMAGSAAAPTNSGQAFPGQERSNVLDPDLAGTRVAAGPVASSISGGSVSTTDLEDIERTTIQRVFEQVKGDKALAGRMLGISRATLYRKLKRYNISAGAPGSPSHTLQ